MGDFGEVMYDKRGTANLIGQAVLEDRGELTRDANYGPYRWRKHGGTREYVFRRVGKLYECRITRDDVMLGPTLHFRPSERAQLMRPVVAQGEVFTAQQVKRAHEARELHESLNHPSDSALSTLLRNGGVLNCHLPSRDVANAQKIIGECAGCLQGKMPNKPETYPPSVQDAAVTTIHVDIMFLRGPGNPKKAPKIPYLVAVDDTYGFICGTKMSDKSAESVTKALVAIVNKFKEWKHAIRTIRYDRD